MQPVTSSNPILLLGAFALHCPCCIFILAVLPFLYEYFVLLKKFLPLLDCPIRGRFAQAVVYFAHFQVQDRMAVCHTVAVHKHIVNFLYTTVLYAPVEGHQLPPRLQAAYVL